MSEPAAEFRSDPSIQFPAVKLLHTAGVALSPGSLVIAIAALLLLSIVGGALDYLLHAATESHSSLISIPGVKIGSAEAVTTPWCGLTRPVIRGMTPGAGIAAKVNGLLQSALALAIWSAVGVVLCRRSALLLFDQDQFDFTKVVIYGIRRWAAAVQAPLIPLAAALFIALLVAIGSLPGRLPYWGTTWLMLVSPLIAVMSVAMTFLLIATLVVWPLMVAAVAADDCESFGSLSRAYSMLTSRPGRTISYGIAGILTGAALLFVTVFAAEVAIQCGLFATAVGSGAQHAGEGLLPSLSAIVHQIVAGIAVSYFWSAATMVYLLLRRDVDGVPLDRLAPADDERPARDPLPVVGIPATDAKVASNGETPAADDRAH